jgi:hypothetical protein
MGTAILKPFKEIMKAESALAIQLRIISNSFDAFLFQAKIIFTSSSI